MHQLRLGAIVKLAVLSDLHIGPNVRGRDLFQPATPTAIDDDYLGRFRRFVDENGVTADYLMVAGDLSESARPSELVQAGRVIETVAESLGVERDRVAITVGNHDKCWAPLGFDPGDQTGITQEMSYLPINRAPGIIADVMRDRSGLTTDCWTTFEFPDLLVLSYNSTWADGPNVKPHYGAVDLQHIDKMRDALLSFRDDGRFKLMLVHHHAWQYEDRIPVPDFSVMDNAQALLELAATLRVDFLVHGHKHVPRFQVALVGDRHHLGVLCAGSFCKLLETALQDQALNQFHLLEFTGRDAQTNRALGNLKSWSFTTGHGWRPSRSDATGIDHINPFGRYASAEEVRDRLRDEVRRQLDLSSYTTWADLLAVDETLAEVPARAVREALEMLKDEGSIDRLLPSDDGNHVLLGKRA